MTRKIFFVVLFAFIYTLSLFAGSYVIRSYDFDITGKTQKWVVENFIVPEEKEEFASWEEVESALNEKEQALLNKRVFKSVEYAYEVEESGGVTYVDVSFKLVDAKTILVLPYPKYDSNYGLRLGLKYWNRNLFGTFSNMRGTVRGTFMPWDFSTMDYYADFTLSDLLIGRTAVSAELTGSVTKDLGLYEYNAFISIDNIVIASKYSLNMAFRVKNDGYQVKYTASSSFGGLSIGPVSFDPAINVLIYEKSKGDSYITPSLSTYGIKIGNVNLSFYDYVKFMNSEKFVVDHAYHSMNMSFSEGEISRYSYSHAFKYYTSDSQDYPNSAFNFTNTLSYKLSDISTVHFYENLYWRGEDFFFSSFDTGIGISQNIRIGEHISVTPTLSQYLTTAFNRENSELSFQPFYTISASAAGNYINWKGNFRDGVYYSFSITEAWDQHYVSRSQKDTYHDRVELQVHKIFWSWFNPSIRILGTYTNDIYDYGSITGTDDGEMGEYLRGIRNKTITDDGRDLNLLAFVVNLNLMTVFPLPPFMSSWMDAYLNIFCDYGFAKHGIDTSDENIKMHYLGFGIEGIGILKEYPSYPIRASIGFDARKLLQFIRKETTSKSFLEVYVGIDFFF